MVMADAHHHAHKSQGTSQRMESFTERHFTAPREPSGQEGSLEGSLSLTPPGLNFRPLQGNQEQSGTTTPHLHAEKDLLITPHSGNLGSWWQRGSREAADQ